MTADDEPLALNLDGLADELEREGLTAPIRPFEDGDQEPGCLWLCVPELTGVRGFVRVTVGF